MKQVAGLLSTYSSDEFGICSALYELGGMVVMHDASGCNSTYTTHDEPRWYDMDSMIFISAISEMEAIMGDDEKLIRDIVETAERLRPRFIAVVGAPIPYMIGTDLEAVAAMIQQETGIISMGFAANGMNHYTKGVSMALREVVNRFCERGVQRDGLEDGISVNILGATPLDFAWNGSVDSTRRWLAEAGMRAGACLAMGSSLDEISQAGRAHVNLVVSYGGLAAAERMRSLFGTPYVVGVPLGKCFAASLAQTLRRAVQTGENIVGYQTGILPDEMTSAPGRRFAVIRESVYGASLAAAIAMERGVAARVLCPLDTEDILLRAGDLRTPEEDDIMRELREVDYVIADEMYRPVCRDGQGFYSLPHEAFSGRIYDAVNPDLIDRPL